MTGRTAHAALVFSAMLLLCGADAAAADSAPKWDESVVKQFSLLPVQDGGRIKPLDTFASFNLLKFRGRRSCPDLSGGRLTPVEWLLDCVFRPETARQYPVFRVDNSEVIVAAGLLPKKKRDYYSYNELLPGREKLMELGRRNMGRDDRERTVVESELATLAMNLRSFEELTSFAEFTQKRFNVAACAPAAALFPGQAECRLSDLLRKAPQIFAAYMDLRKNQAEKKAEFEALTALLHEMDEAVTNAHAIALFPPPAAAESSEWLTPADMVGVAFSGEPVMMNQVGLLADFESLADAASDPAAFAAKAEAFSGSIVRLAESRGEYGRVPLEVTFYRLNLFYNALVLYVLSFIIVACMWMRPKSRIIGWGAFAGVSLPTLLLVAGITLRCVIRGRPPVTTLYETILFVTAVAVLAALFMEWVNRQGAALSLASILGMAGVFFANKYEAGDGADTMATMAAVLDTNFWLATHVTTITIGYAAGLLAGGMAHVFVFGRVLGLRRGDDAFYAGVTRMVYGSLCFSFVFSVVGTVLGGIWANESWGRFWGWDPKENGALMICLWQLAVLHARQDGILRGYGVNIAAVIGGAIIAFSWFGVNLLGVGLHSYGFANGAYSALITFYVAETAVAFLGCLAWFRDRNREASRV